MRHIEIETWARREQYWLYRNFDQPHFNICANLDVTSFHRSLKPHGATFTAGVLYVLARAANDIPAFRYRMRGDTVVEHDIVHPGTAVVSHDDMLGFCSMVYTQDFATFAYEANNVMSRARESPSVAGEPGRDDVLFTTSIPWVSFTSFAHPMHFHPVDSIPRLAWGKRFDESGRIKMPLSVQGHHAMMDGIHVARYFEQLQSYLDEPSIFLPRILEGGAAP